MVLYIQVRYSIGNHCDSYILSQLVGGSACQNLYDVVYFDLEMFGQAQLFFKLVASFNGLYFFYKWPILTTQTHTIRRGALRFATQISPLLNYIDLWMTCTIVSIEQGAVHIQKGLLSLHYVQTVVIVKVHQSINVNQGSSRDGWMVGWMD